MKINKTKKWEELQQHYQRSLCDVQLIDLFNEPDRFEKLSLSYDKLLIDFSKQRITSETILKLVGLAKSCGLEKAIDDLLKGSKLNTTENRAALHTALRLPRNELSPLNNPEISMLVHQQLDKMSGLIEEVSSGLWCGYSGRLIKDVVNLGVGGSDLGPLMVTHALNEFQISVPNPVEIHFASAMDGSQLSNLFGKLNPETTLFVIASKSFTTADTIANASSAKAWLVSACGDEDKINHQHFIGISANSNEMDKWGISSEHQLQLWDWVGGRFSLWSTVGFSIALKIGMAEFKSLLDGAHAMDKHFHSAKMAENLPVILGLIGIWNNNFLEIDTQAILPYDARLKYFPDYLMQLEMESNGKSVAKNGETVNFNTSPIIWGDVGPNAQHAFFQLLHQGTRTVACDFIATIKRYASDASKQQQSLQQQHRLAVANCLAQSRALMMGSAGLPAVKEKPNSLSNFKYHPGNQPSTTILMSSLSPYSIGQLIALYEHKVFVMATIWGINAFDQWGVELGKQMAEETLDALCNVQNKSKFDGSTMGLVDFFKNNSN